MSSAQHHRVAVLPATGVDQAYTYLSEQPLRAGQIVTVFLGPRRLYGVITADDPDKGLPDTKLKPIESVLPIPALTAENLAFLKAMANYTVTPQGLALRQTLCSPEALKPQPPETVYRLAPALTSPEGLTPKRRQIYAALSEDIAALTSQELQAKAGVSAAVIRGFYNRGGLIKATRKPLMAEDISYRLKRQNDALSPQQKTAVEQVANNTGFQTTLLDGVTGSGKTEVIFEVIAARLKKDPAAQCLILMPEIALSEQFLQRFQKRFDGAATVWHSRLTPARRRDNWRAILHGKARVVVGARSALFLPFQNLRQIVIDECHDGSYKQNDQVVYHARDMAVLRARHEGCSCLLVSATPSLESQVNVSNKRYEHCHLPARHGGAQLPKISLVDLKQDKPPAQTFLSPTARSLIETSLKQGEQVLIFLNRRGYAPLTLCRSCGHRFHCPHCSSWLVLHKHVNRLQCHHCGFAQPLPKSCPSCGEKDSLTPCGPGIERITAEINTTFPDVQTVTLSSETSDISASITQLQKGKAQIIIGTQVIAKGHHIPRLALVIIVDGDMGLNGGDPRAGEKVFQLLQQVSGRAGRTAGQTGQVVVQTHNPQSPVMQSFCTGNYHAFIEREIAQRHIADLPPFSRLAALIVSGPKEAEVKAHCQQLARLSPQDDRLRILGPAPAPMLRVRGRYRWRLIAKATRRFPLQRAIKQWVSSTPRPPRGIKIKIDIDPIDL